MLPDDIDPELRCRLPLPRREEIDAEARVLYDSVVTPGAANIRGLKGPGGIQLHSPRFAKVARPVNRYLRYDTGMGARTRELAILTTARECDSRFEWAAHEREALKEGVSPAIVDIIKHRKGVETLEEADKVVVELGREMFGARKVASATFARAVKEFGRQKLVDLVSLMANYAGTAALLVAFDMQLDEGETALLPVER